MSEAHVGCSSSVALEPFLPAHLPWLATWLARPHVAPWYPCPADDLERARNPPPGGAQALIVAAAVPVGYLRWQHVERAMLDALGLPEIPSNSVDIDILIGESHFTGRQIGPAALNLLAQQLLQDPAVPVLGLTSVLANTRAHRAFEKAGFHSVRQYQPNETLGLCHLLVRDLRAERQR